MLKVKEDVMERFNSIYPFTSENIAGYTLIFRAVHGNDDNLAGE